MRNPSKVFVQAPAKVNLSLKVGTLQPDGFHPVETVYQAVNLYDDVIASSADSISLTVEGEGAEAAGSGSSNLAWRAAVLLAERAGVAPNVHLHLRKRIPVAGGMAGGSAGSVGINRVVRQNGTQQDVPHIAQVEMLAGDVFEIHTPGGGGYGKL